MNLKDYFALRGPVPVMGGGSGTGNRPQVYLFLGVLLGAVSKLFYDMVTVGSTVSWGAAGVAVIASFVMFPQLYYTGGLDRKKLSFAHWTLAFQNGFFWSVALDQIAARMSGVS
jgi:hypothetical protein